MDKPKKSKVKKLEKDLLRSLVDPQDSAQRHRYVKRWIYGELPDQKESLTTTEVNAGRQSLWSILHKVITGDE